MTEEDRVRGIVLQVLREALRTRGLAGLILGAPPSPEAALLARWCGPDPSLVHLAYREVEPVERALAGARDEAWMATARVRGAREGLLVVHPANKTLLLMDPVPSAPCFPLGDLWAGDVESWAGGATLPGVLTEVDPALAREVETRLRAGLDAGGGITRALSGLDPRLAAAVMSALGAGRLAARPALVPKLGPWTLGMDPPP